MTQHLYGLAEHIRDTAPCNSIFDGFDRGDSGMSDDHLYQDFDMDCQAEEDAIVQADPGIQLVWLFEQHMRENFIGPLQPFDEDMDEVFF